MEQQYIMLGEEGGCEKVIDREEAKEQIRQGHQLPLMEFGRRIGSSRSNDDGNNDATELLDASFEGRVKDVVQILEQDCSLILNQDSDENTALHLAAKEGHGDIVSKMIDLLLMGPKHRLFILNYRNHEEDTPLYLALLGGYNEIALNLVNVQRRVEAKKPGSSFTDFEGDPFEGQEVDDIIRILEKNPELILKSRDSDGNTAFHMAAKKGHRDTVSKMTCLLMEGKHHRLLTRVLNRRNLDKDTPLYLALLAGYNEIALDLANADRKAATFIAMNEDVLAPRVVPYAAIDVNMRLSRVSEDEDTLANLQKAVEAGEKLRAEKILIKNPSLMQRPDEQGRTFVHIAASYGHVEMLKLVHRKVLKSLMLSETKQGDTALDLSLLGGHEMAAYYLMEVHPRAAYQPSTKGNSPLSIAIERLHPNLVRHITQIASTCPKYIKKSLIQHAQNKQLAHAAIKTNNMDVLQALIDGLPDLMESQDRDGRSPLAFAAYKGYYQQVAYFCEKFVEYISKCDGTGSSPIHQAIVGGHRSVVKKILHRGPQPIHDHVDKYNRNIEYYANNSKSKDMLSFLKEEKII